MSRTRTTSAVPGLAATAARQKDLNPLAIVTGFLPWIGFTFVAQRLAAEEAGGTHAST